MLRVRRAPRLVVKRTQPSPFFHLHAHSKFSHGDALSEVGAMVARVKELGQPGLALTDHGNMAGSVQLYKACQQAGVAPFPGSEMYFVPDRSDKKAKRFHLGLVAYTTAGYAGLVQISTYSHRRESFHHKPLIDWADLAQFKENGWLDGVQITTGCYFGLLVQTLLIQGYDVARHVLYRLARLGQVVVELQRHAIDQEPLSEAEICQALYALASEVGVPVVLTQDAHYVQPEDKPVHESLKRLVSFGPDPDDAVFPGDGFHLCDATWVVDHHEIAHVAASDAFLKQLLADHTLTIPELDSYSYQIPATVPDPLKELRVRVEEELRRENRSKEYFARMEEELSVLDDTGMAGYLVLVGEFTDWLRSNAILFQARGSAAGSLIAWKLGITPVDPIKYKLLFERFMSRDRTKPPDIDLDIEDQRREEALTWLKGRFASSQIGTHAEFGIDEEGKGSLMVAMLSKVRKLGHEIHTYADLPAEAKDELRVLDRYAPYKGPGKNAAGIIVADSLAYLHRVVPMQGIPTGNDKFSITSQYPKDDVEALGIVKLDAMGLKNLTALRNAYEMVKEVGVDYGADLEHIPLDDTRVFTMLRRGDTDGVFQFEGGAMRRGARELGVRSLKDIVIAQALYRPAVMAVDPETGFSGKDLFIARRNGERPMPELHPILAKILGETFGIFIFQEQTIQLLRAIGFNPDDLTAFLKAVKASNGGVGDAARVIAGYEAQMREYADRAGLSAADIDTIWAGLRGYAGYSFNRSHATVYGITAYRTAYFKLHHPLEYGTALLQAWAGHPKEPRVIETVRGMQIPLRRAHVNISGANYSIDRKGKSVRKALVSIAGIGETAAKVLADNAPYESIADMVARLPARPISGGKSYTKTGELNGVLGKLKEAGALAGLD